jgi:hypothetical protein
VNRERENCYDCEEKEHKCKPCHQTETILKCGTVTGSGPLSCNSIALNGVGSNGYGFQPIVQAAVTLDTSKLIDPTVKIDFSSLISFKTCSEYYFLRLAFKLSKFCCGKSIPLGTWTFEQVHQEGAPTAATPILGEFVQETDPFCFTWCECDDDCPECCRYVVEIVDQQCYNIDFVTVSNISLTALAVGLKKSHRD